MQEGATTATGVAALRKNTVRSMIMQILASRMTNEVHIDSESVNSHLKFQHLRLWLGLRAYGTTRIVYEGHFTVLQFEFQPTRQHFIT